MSTKPTNNKKALKACLDSIAKNEPETSEAPQAGPKGPKATTKEEYLKKAAAKGESTVSPFQVSASLLAKRGLETEENGLKAIITVFSLIDLNGDKEHGVAATMSGDFYSLRESVKKANVEECIVNNETIPMVAGCLKAKFVSKNVMDITVRHTPVSCADLGKYLAANNEACWMLYCPYRGEKGAHEPASVDIGVQLYHYAMAWQRALTGEPLHFDKVEVVNYFIDADELRVLDTMYTTQDPNFGQRRGSITIKR